MTELTQKHLKSVLSYDLQTGVFTWKIDCRNMVKAGCTAGYIKDNGYRSISIKGGKHYAHRLVFLFMTGNTPKNDVDHINNVKDDNRWVNLREATRSQNNANMGIRRDNSSGFRGVVWHKNRNKWMAQIYVGGKAKYLGIFACKCAAATAYNEGAKKYFGEFASLNEVNGIGTGCKRYVH